MRSSAGRYLPAIGSNRRVRIMLDEHSQKFADALFRRYPQWKDGSSVRKDREGRDYLHVQVARPVEDDQVGGLTISTADAEVTIECGRHYHGHFPNDQLLSDIFEFLDRVISEEYVFVRYQRGDGVLGGSRIDQSTAASLIENGPPRLPLHPRSRTVPDTVSLWSWKGTFDRIVKH